MDVIFYQVCVIEVTILIIGILLCLKGVNVLKNDKSDDPSLLWGFLIFFFGLSLIAQTSSSDGYTVRYIASIFDPCLKNSISFECLDQELKLTIKKNNEHRSGE